MDPDKVLTTKPSTLDGCRTTKFVLQDMTQKQSVKPARMPQYTMLTTRNILKNTPWTLAVCCSTKIVVQQITDGMSETDRSTEHFQKIFHVPCPYVSSMYPDHPCESTVERMTSVTGAPRSTSADGAFRVDRKKTSHNTCPRSMSRYMYYRCTFCCVTCK